MQATVEPSLWLTPQCFKPPTSPQLCNHIRIPYMQQMLPAHSTNPTHLHNVAHSAVGVCFSCCRTHTLHLLLCPNKNFNSWSYMEHASSSHSLLWAIYSFL